MTVRVDFLNYTTALTPECTETQFSVLIGGHTRTVPLCDVRTGYSSQWGAAGGGTDGPREEATGLPNFIF